MTPHKVFGKRGLALLLRDDHAGRGAKDATGDHSKSYPTPPNAHEAKRSPKISRSREWLVQSNAGKTKALCALHAYLQTNTRGGQHINRNHPSHHSWRRGPHNNPWLTGSFSQSRGHFLAICKTTCHNKMTDGAANKVLTGCNPRVQGNGQHVLAHCACSKTQACTALIIYS